MEVEEDVVEPLGMTRRWLPPTLWKGEEGREGERVRSVAGGSTEKWKRVRWKGMINRSHLSMSVWRGVI
jgi:hypothetical protein